MSFWIRNQCKSKLIKCDYFSVESEYVFGLSCDFELVLGTYSTKEKALKVLDMIQEHIEKMYIGTANYMGKPFQMPQDSEVE